MGKGFTYNTTMRNLLTKATSKLMTSKHIHLNKFKKKKGAVNILEILVIAIIVIVVAWIFKDQLSTLVTSLTGKIATQVENLFGTT